MIHVDDSRNDHEKVSIERQLHRQWEGRWCNAAMATCSIPAHLIGALHRMHFIDSFPFAFTVRVQPTGVFFLFVFPKSSTLRSSTVKEEAIWAFEATVTHSVHVVCYRTLRREFVLKNKATQHAYTTVSLYTCEKSV